jgi:hypothetical protein
MRFPFIFAFVFSLIAIALSKSLEGKLQKIKKKIF